MKPAKITIAMTRETTFGPVTASAPSQGLQETPDAMIEMQTQRCHRHDVETETGHYREACHHVLIHTQVLVLSRRESYRSQREVKDVKHTMKMASSSHQRIVWAANVLDAGRYLRTRLPAHPGQLHRRDDMQATALISTRRTTHSKSPYPNSASPTVREIANKR